MSRILLVDDDEHLLDIARSFLKRENPNFQLTTSTSATDAFQKLISEKFDAVVSDYKMPIMDGLELLRQLREADNNVPFIIFTGKGREEVAMQALNLGADRYFMKGGDPRSLYGELAHIIACLIEHRQMETTLRESERRFRTIFHEANDAIFVVKVLDNQRISPYIEVNNVACRRYGYTREEFLQMTSRDLHDPEEIEELIQAGIFEKLQSEESFTFESLHIAKDGTRIPVEIATTWITLGKERLRLGYAHNITKQKKAENALRESEEKFRILFNEANDGILLADPESKRFLMNNKMICKMLGYKPEKINSLTVMDIHPSESMPHVLEQFERQVRREISVAYNIPVLRKDGSVFYADINSRPVTIGEKEYLLGVFRKISDHKSTEDQLQESEQRFRGIFRAIPDPAYLYQRTPEDRIILLEVNKAALEISHGLLAFCVNQDLDAMVSSDTFSPMLQRHGVALWEVAVNVRGVLESGKALQIEKNFIGHSGEQLFFLLRYVPTSSNCVLLISNDLTERQRQAEELKEFAHAMVHDLRTPLLSIEGYADLLQSEYDEDAAKTIGRLAQKIQHILRRSVELAEAGRIIEASSLVDLTPIIREVTDSTIPKHITIHIDELPTVRGDRLKLAQVFQNLLENAILHGEPRTIEVRRTEFKNTFQVLVTNDGKPILPEHRDRLFQRGFTTKNHGEGLGLAIVQKLVEAHGWEIHLDASQKTTFRIIIPK